MLLLAIAFLSAAVITGLILVYAGLRQHRSIPALGLSHGVLAISGFGLLIAHILQSETSKANNFAALLFILALTGGGLLFALRETGKPPSMPLVGIHAIMALAGFGILLAGYGVFTG